MEVASGSPRRLAAGSVKQAPTTAGPWTHCPASPVPLDSVATRVRMGSQGGRAWASGQNWAEPGGVDRGGRWRGRQNPRGVRGTGL